MTRIRRPTTREIEARLADPELHFSYPELGATRNPECWNDGALGTAYDVDRHQRLLGTGRALFERARDALSAWKHFDVPWIEFYGASAPVHTGQGVATLVGMSGLWLLNPCRVVYTELSEGSADVAAFAYGTLTGHVESGEERFQLSFDPATAAVTYEISAFSRPALLLSKLGYPAVRLVQKRFARASAAALARAVA